MSIERKAFGNRHCRAEHIDIDANVNIIVMSFSSVAESSRQSRLSFIVTVPCSSRKRAGACLLRLPVLFYKS
jgi:hypothetical protein